MNEGVKILIERMKTNPEEFAIGDGGFHTLSKWGRLIADYQTYLEPEDCEILKNAINKLHQQTFTEKVMKELLAPEENDDLGKPWYTARAQGTGLGGVTPVRSSVTLNNTNTVGTWGTSSISLAEAQHQSTVEHMKAHLQALQAGTSTKHQTLFGKLKNYLHNE